MDAYDLEGEMTEEEYRNEAIVNTIMALQDRDFIYVDKIGYGSFGAVVELVDCVLRKRVAAKIVLQEYVSQSEIMIWRDLEHENILTLNDVIYFSDIRTCVFLMEKQPYALDKRLEEPSFVYDVHSFEKASSWLRGICEGVKYLHDQKLSHLDIKVSNVLISDAEAPKICDFGSLIRTERAANSYVSPFLYRPPEGLIATNGNQAIVDAFKYDIYTLGILTLEMFTKQTLLKTFTDNWRDEDPSWVAVMYPKIFDLLQKKKFKSLVKKAFLKAEVQKDTLKLLRNFICACVQLNPQARPTIDELLQHKIFGGLTIFPKKVNDVWGKKESFTKVQFLLHLYIARAASLRFTYSIPEVPRSNEDENENACALESAQTMSHSQKSSEDIIAAEPEEAENKTPESKNSCVEDVNVISVVEQSLECEEKVENDRVLSKKGSVRVWFIQKKEVVARAFNRFFDVFSRSRK